MAAPWYTTREAVKLAHTVSGQTRNSQLDRLIASSSRRIESLTDGRVFVPYYATKFFSWPSNLPSSSFRLWLETDLISVTEITLRAQDDDPQTLPSGAYFLEPANYGPPYRSIEINMEQSYVWGGGQTGQQSISITGLWGYRNNTESVGTLSSSINSSVTTITVSNAYAIGVGDSLLIDSEQLFVTEKRLGSTLTVLMTDIAADKGVTNIEVSDGTLFTDGETITIDAERLRIDDIADNTLIVTRSIDGSVLAAHDSGTAIYALRSLTVSRGSSGTTAASHTSPVTVYRYVVPEDIEHLCLAQVIVSLMSETDGYSIVIGSDLNVRRYEGRSIQELRDEVRRSYYMRKIAGI